MSEEVTLLEIQQLLPTCCPSLPSVQFSLDHDHQQSFEEPRLRAGPPQPVAGHSHWEAQVSRNSLQRLFLHAQRLQTHLQPHSGVCLGSGNKTHVNENQELHL